MMQYLGLFTLISPIILWVFFYFLFNILAGQMPQWSYPFWIVGALIDLWCNLTVGTVVFLQLPDMINKGFLSARMDDLILNDNGWRGKLAIKIVGVLLEPFDKTHQHTTHGK